MTPPNRTLFVTLACAAALALGTIGVLRWIRHARAELLPVVVPAAMPAAEVLEPAAGAIANRMLQDGRDALHRPQRTRLAVLTFDDGPYPVATPALLAQLQRLHVPAVFFIIGRDASEQPALAARAAADGIEIGNHTQSHPEMASLAATAQSDEVETGASSIERAAGRRPNYFRPPHGNFNAATIDAARGQGETVALWDVDPGDWRRVTPDAIVDNVTMHARAPAVILLHDGSTATIDALPRIVAAYRRAGFEFVTLS
ncbi:MAG: polysaccharide deacetylase family protein, partial [Candidatus Eremiobacteraeota bacterium]|nr:polysaccharide deacetylase family protein [Candidatus Eremiobacteraeota bacterium]